MFTESEAVQRINNQCRVWLHKPSGVKYRKDTSNGAVNLMQSLSAKPRYATDEELRDGNIWSQV